MPDGETKKTETRANLGFDAKLWLATELLCFNLDETEYEHVVLGLISLTYISDPFDEHHARLVERGGLRRDQSRGQGRIPRRQSPFPPRSLNVMMYTMSPLFNQFRANFHQSSILATLLPKLLSGELSIAVLESEASA